MIATATGRDTVADLALDGACHHAIRHLRAGDPIDTAAAVLEDAARAVAWQGLIPTGPV